VYLNRGSRDLLHAIPKFLLNHARYRDWFEKETVADVNHLTGKSCADLAAADEAVQAIIAKADPAQDEVLILLLHRRILRFSMLIAGTDPDDKNPLFHKLDPILNA